MAIPKRVRFEVLRRDNNTCRYCHATDTPLTIDHVVPTVLGGTDDPSNLVAACKDCNAGKSSSNPDAATVAQVSDDAIRWSVAMQAAADKAMRGNEELREHLGVFESYWYQLVPSYKQGHPKWRLPSDWAAALERLLVAGLPAAMVLDCIDIACNQRGNIDNAFRYMLGVANNKLAKLQEDAAAILADEVDEPRTETPEQAAYWGGYLAALREPQVATSHLAARALSRVVDGPQDWNSTTIKAGV